MYYISSVQGDRVGITDTYDGVQEFYTQREVNNMVESRKLLIYGTSLWNHVAECTVVPYPRRCIREELEKLLLEWKNLHNPWKGYPVRDYLASIEPGWKISCTSVDYSIAMRRRYKYVTSLMKMAPDTWKIFCKEHVLDEQEVNSSVAQHMLDVAYCGSESCTIHVVRFGD